MNNRLPLQIKGRTLLLSTSYLESLSAEVWIGPHENGPADDDNDRVLVDRRNAEQEYNEGKTKRPSGVSVFSITDADEDGYYELDTSSWPAGYYRFNYHGVANEETPHGSKLDSTKRDLQYSWAIFSSEIIEDPEVQPFIYYEPNGRGFCFRIKISEDGSIYPAGMNV